MKKAILYYDGKCQVCKNEMILLSKLKNSELELANLCEVKTDVVQDDLLRILHMRTTNGEWLTGLDATVAAWQYTKIGFIFKILRWPGIRPFADKIYLSWTNKRFCKTKENNR